MVIGTGDELQGRRVDESWLLFFFVGLLAQLVDGALGMAFGVTATTVMLSFGTAPAQAKALDLAGDEVDAGQQADRAVALIFMHTCEGRMGARRRSCRRMRRPYRSRVEVSAPS